MTNVNKESVARSLTSFLGEVPKEIEEAGDISKSAVSGKDIAKIILGDHLLEVMGASNPLSLGWGRIAPTKSYERKP